MKKKTGSIFQCEWSNEKNSRDGSRGSRSRPV